MPANSHLKSIRNEGREGYDAPCPFFHVPFNLRRIDKCRFLSDNMLNQSIQEAAMQQQTTSVAVGDILGMKDLRDSPFDLVQAVRRGLPYQSVTKVAEALDLSTNQLAKYLPVTARTLQRYQKEKQKLDRDLSDHLLQIARVFARCRQVMEDGERARRWLQTPSIPLGNVPPMSLLDTYTGVEMVMDELGRIEHGLAA